MSARYVRTLARAWITADAAVPFHDTINREQSPLAPVWCSLAFFAISKTGVIGCAGYQEDGIIDLIFSSTPGIGDDMLLSAAEASAALFLTRHDPSALLTLLDSEPIRELTAGDADRWYRLGIGVNYKYSFTT